MADPVLVERHRSRMTPAGASRTHLTRPAARQAVWVVQRLASTMGIVWLRFKYHGLAIDFRSHLAGGCTITCSDGPSLVLTGVHVARGTTIRADNGGRLRD